MTLGKKIKEYRQKKNFTLQELSEKAGISKGFLSDIENDKKIPSIIVVQKIAKTFNCSIDYLVNNQQNIFSIENECTHIDKILQEKVIIPFKKLDSEQQQEVINFLNFQLSKSKKINQQKMTTDTVDFSIKND